MSAVCPGGREATWDANRSSEEGVNVGEERVISGGSNGESVVVRDEHRERILVAWSCFSKRRGSCHK